MSEASTTPDIRHEASGNRGRYFIPMDEGGQAELTYSLDRDGDMVIDHTFVPPKLRGRGIALGLVERAVADARDKSLRIVPLCPYVASEFRHHPEWAELAKS